MKNINDVIAKIETLKTEIVKLQHEIDETYNDKQHNKINEHEQNKIFKNQLNYVNDKLENMIENCNDCLYDNLIDETII